MTHTQQPAPVIYDFTVYRNIRKQKGKKFNIVSPELLQSKTVVEVSTAESVDIKDSETGKTSQIKFFFIPKGKKETLSDGSVYTTTDDSFFAGLTKVPHDGQFSSTNSNVQVTVASMTIFPNKQSQRKTMAHELYGHALRYIEKLPWKHDNGGPVDMSIISIEDRTH